MSRAHACLRVGEGGPVAMRGGFAGASGQVVPRRRREMRADSDRARAARMRRAMARTDIAALGAA